MKKKVVVMFVCPQCGNTLTYKKNERFTLPLSKYCPDCGQELSWGITTDKIMEECTKDEQSNH